MLDACKKGKLVLRKYEVENQFVKDSVRDDMVDVILDEETKDDLTKK